MRAGCKGQVALGLHRKILLVAIVGVAAGSAFLGVVFDAYFVVSVKKYQELNAGKNPAKAVSLNYALKHGQKQVLRASHHNPGSIEFDGAHHLAVA